jgi:hypothetical protein
MEQGQRVGHAASISGSRARRSRPAASGWNFCTEKGSPPIRRAAPLLKKPDLAVHAAVLTALSALLAALSGLLLAALMLLTGLSLPALLLLAGLALPTLLGIALLLLLARILLLIRHVDVLHKFRKPPVRRNDNPPGMVWFLPALLELLATACKIKRKSGLNGGQRAVPRVPR